MCDGEEEEFAQELRILVVGFTREKFYRNTLCSEEKGILRKTLQRREKENLIAHLITFPCNPFPRKLLL